MADTAKPDASDETLESMKGPNYARWGRADCWTLSETTCLLLRWEPLSRDAIPDGPLRDRFGPQVSKPTMGG